LAVHFTVALVAFRTPYAALIVSHPQPRQVFIWKIIPNYSKFPYEKRKDAALLSADGNPDADMFLSLQYVTG
jgi:hypothetical protein